MPNPLATPTPTLTVFAGPLTAEYEQGELRYVRWGDREVLRRIYVAVRDHTWATIPIQVKETHLEITATYFLIELEATHQQDGVVFEWHGRLEGSADGSIRVHMKGEAKTAFLRNRIGLCVLHPMETCAGQPAFIEHTDGTTENSRFPDLVSPHQPFLDLRALSCEVAPGAQAKLRFTGDEFETEDQRNWSDHTFKTYSTRLSLPIPVAVKPGDRIEQSVTLTLTGKSASLPAAGSKRVPIEVTIYQETVPFPKVGIAYKEGLTPMGTHTRVDLNFTGPDWPQQLRAAAAWGLPLEVAWLTDHPETDLAPLKQELAQAGATVVRVLLFPTSGSPTDPASIAAAKRVHQWTIAAGSRANFADLNRNREIIAGADEVVWSVDPYVHANDYRTVVENLQGQAGAPRTAKSFSGERPLVASTVRVPDIVSHAGWLAISLKQLSLNGVASITFDLEAAPLIQINQFFGSAIMNSTSSEPLTADALVIQRPAPGSGTERIAFIANFSPSNIKVRLAGQRVSLAPFELKSHIL